MRVGLRWAGGGRDGHDSSGYSVTGAGPVWYGPALIGILLSAI